jgi:hypothetical protein
MGVTSLREGTGYDAMTDFRDTFMEDYAHLALCRLAAHAAVAQEVRDALSSTTHPSTRPPACNPRKCKRFRPSI